jgi:hypothetical protein
MKQVGLALVGLGNVGRRFLRLLIERDDMLREKYGIVFRVHCVVDSSGVAISDEGFDLPSLIQHKVRGLKLRELREFEEGMTLGVALDIVQCEILLEASPVNLNTGNPGQTVGQRWSTACISYWPTRVHWRLLKQSLIVSRRTAKWVYSIAQRFVAGFLCSTLLGVTWFAEKF